MPPPARASRELHLWGYSQGSGPLPESRRSLVETVSKEGDCQELMEHSFIGEEYNSQSKVRMPRVSIVFAYVDCGSVPKVQTVAGLSSGHGKASI